MVLDEAYIEFARAPECLNGLESMVAEDRPACSVDEHSQKHMALPV